MQALKLPPGVTNDISRSLSDLKKGVSTAQKTVKNVKSIIDKTIEVGKEVGGIFNALKAPSDTFSGRGKSPTGGHRYYFEQYNDMVLERYIQADYAFDPLLKRHFFAMLFLPPKLFDLFEDDVSTFSEVEDDLPLLLDNVNIGNLGNTKFMQSSDISNISVMPTYQQSNQVVANIFAPVKHDSKSMMTGIHFIHELVVRWIALMGYPGEMEIGYPHIDFNELDADSSDETLRYTSSFYKGNILIIQHDPTNILLVKEAYLCLNVFPVTVDGIGDFSRSSSDMINYNITFNTDFIACGAQIRENAHNQLYKSLVTWIPPDSSEYTPTPLDVSYRTHTTTSTTTRTTDKSKSPLDVSYRAHTTASTAARTIDKSKSALDALSKVLKEVSRFKLPQPPSAGKMLTSGGTSSFQIEPDEYRTRFFNSVTQINITKGND